MDLNRFTEKSQNALSQAQNKAATLGHQQVDGEHVALALLEQPEGILPRLFQRMDVPVETLREGLTRELERLPKTSGPGLEPGKIYLTPRLGKLLANAEATAKRMRDE